jgi:hypothetical protein
MTVIDKYSDQSFLILRKTGLPLIELKCKWYNSDSKSFSDHF